MFVNFWDFYFKGIFGYFIGNKYALLCSFYNLHYKATRLHLLTDWIAHLYLQILPHVPKFQPFKS